MAATIPLALVTLPVSVAILASGKVQYWAQTLGFLPIRVLGDLPGAFPVPAILTPLTATLVHGSPLHLMLNITLLVLGGRNVEGVLGWRGMLALYVAGAYGAALAVWIAHPAGLSPLMGASGAVAGVLGAVAALFNRGRRDLGPIPGWLIQGAWILGAWTLGNYLLARAFSTPEATMSWEAHAGGFAAGLVLAPVLFKWRWRWA